MLQSRHLVCACHSVELWQIASFENNTIVFSDILKKTQSDSRIIECQRVSNFISHTHDFKSKSKSNVYRCFEWFSLFVCSSIPGCHFTPCSSSLFILARIIHSINPHYYNYFKFEILPTHYIHFFIYLTLFILLLLELVLIFYMKKRVYYGLFH